MKRIYLICFFFIFAFQLLQAQETRPSVSQGHNPTLHTINVGSGFKLYGIDEQLQKAEDLFNAGNYNACTRMLDSLGRIPYLNKRDRENLLTLLAKAYIEEDETQKSEEAVRQMLVNNPHYELIEANNTESFNLLVKSFEIHPLLSLGARNTVLAPTMITTKTYSQNPNLNYQTPYLTSKYFLMYYGWLELEFRKNLSVNMELIFWNLISGRKMDGNKGWIQNYNENMGFMEVPIYVRKYLKLQAYKNFLMYGSAGGSWLYMHSANFSISNSIPIYNSAGQLTGYSSNTSTNIDILPQRNVNTFNWLVGAGIGYKLKNITLTLDWRYYGGLNSLTNAGAPMKNALLAQTYFYTDNAVKLNKAELGATISFTLSHSVKKKPLQNSAYTFKSHF
jgi:hypothetical protein